MNTFDLHDFQVTNVVRKLTNFLGEIQLERKLQRFERALNVAKPIYSNFHLRNQHPWFSAFVEYRKLEKSAQSIRYNLTDNIKELARDAKIITELQRDMPATVKRKFQTGLLSVNNASDYLFELNIAWHFFMRQHKIQWLDDDEQPHGEFCVFADASLCFDVECKNISVDKARKIKRSDFYKLLGDLIPRIESSHLKGTVQIEIPDTFSKMNYRPAQLGFIIGEALLDKIKQTGILEGKYEADYGTVAYSLQSQDGKIVNISELIKGLSQRKSNAAHGVIYTDSSKPAPVDPVEITCECAKADNLLEGIQDIILEAARRQLKRDKPALIACNIPEISDFTRLGSNSGLELITRSAFQKENTDHVAAITYSSDKKFAHTLEGERASFPGIEFKNSNCKFPQATAYKYLGVYLR